MIIVEGPDGGGKTTLIRRLSEDLGLRIAPRVVAQDTTAMVDLKLWVEENLNLGYHMKLYDRHRLISEPIYGAVKNRVEPGFDDLGWMTAMMSNFYEIEPTIIYCLPPKAAVIHNVQHGYDDNSAVFSQIEVIYSAYIAKAAMDVGLEFAYVYDYTRMTYETILEKIELELERNRSE